MLTVETGSKPIRSEATATQSQQLKERADL
jgi:hypothetical protein